MVYQVSPKTLARRQALRKVGRLARRGLGCTLISRKLGITPRAVMNRLRSLGLNRAPGYFRKPGSLRRLERGAELYRGGLGIKASGKAAKVHPITLRKFLMQTGQYRGAVGAVPHRPAPRLNRFDSDSLVMADYRREARAASRPDALWGTHAMGSKALTRYYTHRSSLLPLARANAKRKWRNDAGDRHRCKLARMRLRVRRQSDRLLGRLDSITSQGCYQYAE